MAELLAFITDNNVPLVTPVDAPEITILRTDTGAAVITGAAMLELGLGLYRYSFAPVSTLEYVALVDADPNVTGQVPASERYQPVAVSGITDTRIETDIPAILLDTAAIDLRLPSDPADESLQQAAHTQTQADIAALNDLSVVDVQTALTNQGYTTVRAPKLDNLDATISGVPGAVDTTLSGTHGASGWETATSVALDAAAIDAIWNEIQSGHVTAGSFGALLNAAISTLQTEVAAAARAVTNQTEHDATQAAIAALSNPTVAAIVAGILGGIVDGTVDVQEVLLRTNAFVRGKVVRDDVSVTTIDVEYYEEDSTTIAFENRKTTALRTPQ